MERKPLSPIEKKLNNIIGKINWLLGFNPKTSKKNFNQTGRYLICWSPIQQKGSLCINTVPGSGGVDISKNIPYHDLYNFCLGYYARLKETQTSK